jgi:hypothetical protein
MTAALGQESPLLVRLQQRPNYAERNCLNLKGVLAIKPVAPPFYETPSRALHTEL